MKYMVFLGALMASTLLWAASHSQASLRYQRAECPAHFAMVKLCRSTPVTGDHTFPARNYRSIALCQNGASTLIAFLTKRGDLFTFAAKTDEQAEASVYSVATEIVSYQLAVGLAETTEKNARLTMSYMAGASGAASSTYTCE